MTDKHKGLSSTSPLFHLAFDATGTGRQSAVIKGGDAAYQYCIAQSLRCCLVARLLEMLGVLILTQRVPRGLFIETRPDSLPLRAIPRRVWRMPHRLPPSRRCDSSDSGVLMPSNMSRVVAPKRRPGLYTGCKRPTCQEDRPQAVEDLPPACDTSSKVHARVAHALTQASAVFSQSRAPVFP